MVESIQIKNDKKNPNLHQIPSQTSFIILREYFNRKKMSQKLIL